MDNKLDGSTTEHSDSDSGESWTLLEPSPSYSEDAPDIPENVHKDEETAYTTDKDEDTDGISIISDSDPESSTPCEQLNYEEVPLVDDNRPSEQTNQNFISIVPNPPNNHDHHESSIRCDNFLGDSSGKMKTYVHRRNKKLSTVLNIIVLGSVITAAGVAIGHMWGVRDDCSMHTPSSVNKILSNLYKLQEENAYLRTKIKELTIANYQRKIDIDKPHAFKQKCRKVFEESLTNKNAVKMTKCMDSENSDKTMDSHLMQPEFEQNFLTDLDKLKNFYKQNKSWLDIEVARRLKGEELSLKTMKHTMKRNKSGEQRNVVNNDKLNQQLLSSIVQVGIVDTTGKKIPLDDIQEENKKDIPEMKKISYADSLKSEKGEVKEDHVEKKVHKRSIDGISIKKKMQIKRPRNPQADYFSDDEIRKDNRYTGNKHKQERKKYDRHKSNKKQKSKNKYEQWEMKGGYMNDYDDLSIISSQEVTVKNVDKTSNQNFNADIFSNQFMETDNNQQQKTETVNKKEIEKGNTLKGEKNNNREDNWYEKRAILRMEARKKLEHELFGENTPNNAGWYFRRMQRREQCRAKPDNTTYRKVSKRNMNFKTKH